MVLSSLTARVLETRRMAETVAETDDGLDEPSATAAGWWQDWPRWAPPATAVPWLAGRRVPRMLPITPVWLIAPTLILYGFGGGVYALPLVTGVLTWDGGDIGLVGFGQPVSFVAYGAALAVAAASYQSRTRPVPVQGATCPVPRGSVAA